jgi:hypothetical protein
VKLELDSKPVAPSATGSRREVTPDERAELRTADAMRELLLTKGWKIYAAVLQAHLQSKRNEFENPAETNRDGIAQVLRSESAKGAIMGLRLALSIPDGILSNDKVLRGRLGLTSEDEV